MSTADHATATSLVDEYLPVYDVVITERLVVDAPGAAVYRAAADLDFMRIRTPLLSASLFVRGLPDRIRGVAPPPPPELRLTAADGPSLPGWLLLGERPGQEVAFGAVGRFWSPQIEWRDVPLEEFARFAEPGWGKIACHFLVREVADGRSVLTYECRTATTDAAAARRMRRYWAVIRPFVGHILRATLRTIATDAAGAGPTRT